LYVLSGITVFADVFSGIKNWVTPMNSLSYSCLLLAVLQVGAGCAAIVETRQASRIVCGSGLTLSAYYVLSLALSVYAYLAARLNFFRTSHAVALLIWAATYVSIQQTFHTETE
jgi:hypothetical protein